MSEKTPTPEQEEINRLREHNSELLADLKKAKASVKELTAQVETLTGERDAAVTSERKIRLDNPVDEMADRVSVLPGHFRAEFEKFWQFVLVDGEIVIQDKDGNPAIIKPETSKEKERPATFTERDVKTLCNQSDNTKVFDCMLKGSGMSGSGAGPSHISGGVPKSPEQSKPAPVAFGLK